MGFKVKIVLAKYGNSTVNFYNVGNLWHCSWNGCSKGLMKLSDL